ncbi:MAG: helix-turn-helix domain-containing protein [Clostridia bacterium]|nr:helix-turn-helix domain-containing protein [Clostridia bacterium]
MYTIKDLSMMCGLTDRTLRNYLSMGILKGEKVDGAWIFNAQQLDDFFKNDVVASAIQANRGALLKDYLIDYEKKENSAYVILDLPCEDAERIAAFFCEAVNKRFGLSMTFDRQKGLNRVVLAGKAKVVCDVVLAYDSAFQ